MADSDLTEPESPKPDSKTVSEKVEVEQPPVEPEKDKKKNKVEVRLQAVGDAPILKQKNFNVDRDKQISWIILFLRKFLKLKEQESIYLYVNQAFAPSPDQTIGNLADCFSQDNKLVLHYSRGQAWG